MKLTKSKGFTLVEVLVMMSIISIIIIAFFTFLNSSIRVNSKNDRDIVALNIAQSEIENLRNQIKDGKKNNFNTIDNEDININQEISYEKDANNTTYKVDLLLEESSSLYTINIDVKLKDTKLSNKNINFITQVFGG